MLHHVFLQISESATALIGLSLSLGILVYFTLHNWHKMAALSRNRSQLLSVGVLLAIVLAIFQFSTSREGGTSATASDDFFAAGSPSPRPQFLTAEALNAAGYAVVATYHNDNA